MASVTIRAGYDTGAGRARTWTREEVMPMDKEVLIQYCEMKEEIKDIRRRIQKLDRFLKEPHQVSDTVKGTRRDGTIGSIKV